MVMGSLKPGATYVYERVDDVVYAREAGSLDRTEIGRDYDSKNKTLQRVLEDKLWGEIRSAAKTNNTLQSALEQCIIIYKLSKEYKDGI
jgi:hypothetical protein